MLSGGQWEYGAWGAYQIERRVGQSPVGAVYQARRSGQNHPVLLVVLHLPPGTPLEYARLYARFAQARAALTGLLHPHILSVHECGMQAGALYLVTTWVQAISLDQFLKQHGRLNVHQTMQILAQVASALDYAHEQGVVHGMLGLSSVMITGELTVRVAYFGLSAMLAAYGTQMSWRSHEPYAHLSGASGVFLGNPASISPEQVIGLPAGPRADLYAFGVMLFTLLSGGLPFDGTTFLEMALNRLSQPVPELPTRTSELPAGCDEVISRLMELDPVRRYRCAAEAIEALQCLLTKRSMPVGSTSTPPARTIHQQVERLRPQEGQPAPALPALAAREAFDPFVWWSAQSISSASPSSSGTAPGRSSAGLPTTRPRQRALLHGRRTLLKSLAAGAATTGVFVVSGCSLAALIQRGKRASAKRVIGTTRQVINSARPFTNARDGQASLLLRLDNGTFVACERACSHAGFPVGYDPERGLLVCPAHGATFDPQHGFRHVSGPGSGPLTSVSIKVHSDGTVTTE